MKTDLKDVAEALPKKRERSTKLGGKVDVGELPDGRAIADLSRSELNKALVKLEIPGAAASNTLEAAVALYAHFLQQKYDEAGEHEISYWMVLTGEDADDEERDGDDNGGDDK